MNWRHDTVMALVQEKKGGGPYTKDERTKRQNEVHRLHFEFGYSAVKISDMMKVNRNTINEDIKCLYSNIKDELRQDSENFILKQIGRLESQRVRIVKNITENKIDDNGIKHEKLLLDVDTRINNLLIKVSSGNKTEPKNKIHEETIKDLVLYLLVKHNKDHKLNKEQITSEIINLQQCTVDEAEKIFLQIENMGLKLCSKFLGIKFTYDLLEFAYLRKYIAPSDSFRVKIHSLFILNANLEYEIEQLNKRYSEKYGPKNKWSDDMFEEHEKDETKLQTKHAETFSKIATDALEILSDQRAIKKYIKYINVFFAEEKSQFDKSMNLKE